MAYVRLRNARMAEIFVEIHTHVCHTVRIWSFVKILPWSHGCLKNLSATTRANATTSRVHIPRRTRVIGETKRRAGSRQTFHLTFTISSGNIFHGRATDDGGGVTVLWNWIVVAVTRLAGKHSAAMADYVRCKLLLLVRIKEEGVTSTWQYNPAGLHSSIKTESLALSAGLYLRLHGPPILSAEIGPIILTGAPVAVESSAVTWRPNPTEPKVFGPKLLRTTRPRKFRGISLLVRREHLAVILSSADFYVYTINDERSCRDRYLCARVSVSRTVATYFSAENFNQQETNWY